MYQKEFAEVCFVFELLSTREASSCRNMYSTILLYICSEKFGSDWRSPYLHILAGMVCGVMGKN